MAMPTHQPFEDWLFSEERLSPEQEQSLQAHLHSCERCRSLEASWKGIEGLFTSVEAPAPASGFADRWQARLANDHRQRARRQSWAMLGITGGLSLAIFFYMCAQVLDVLRAPDQILILLVYRITSLIVYTEATRDLIVSFLAPVMVAVPVLFWVGVMGGISFLSVLWFVAFRQLTSPRRVRL